MVNRIVKESSYGPANVLIIQFLALHGNSGFGEIRNNLEQQEILYTKRGLISRLNRLKEEGLIEKNYSYEPYHPTYSLTRKGFDIPSYLGLFFKNSIMKEILKIRNQFPDDIKFLKFMTKVIGVYTIYMEILASRFTSPNNSLETNLQRRKAFLDNSFPITLPIANNTSGLTKDEIALYSKEYSRIAGELSKFEDVLRKSYPLEMTLCGAVHYKVENLVQYLTNQKHKKSPNQ